MSEKPLGMKISQEEREEAEQFLLKHGIAVSERTAERYVEVLKDVFQFGTKKQEKESLAAIKRGIFDGEDDKDYDGLAVESGIPVASYCSHHILPWFGHVHIGYIARGRLLGLSKFTRIVSHFQTGIQTQEKFTGDVARFLVKTVSPDVIVMTEAIHTCKVVRGVQSPFATFRTTIVRGAFARQTDVGPRFEFMNMIKLRGM